MFNTSLSLECLWATVFMKNISIVFYVFTTFTIMSLELNAVTHFCECHGQVWRYAIKVDKIFSKLLSFVDIDKMCSNCENFNSIVTSVNNFVHWQCFIIFFCSHLQVFIVAVQKNVLFKLKIPACTTYLVLLETVQNVIVNSRRSLGKTFAWAISAKKSLAVTSGISVRKRTNVCLPYMFIKYRTLQAPPARCYHLMVYNTNIKS